MASSEERLCGGEQEHAAVALLIIDMINDLEFDDGQRIRPQAESAAEHICVFKQRFYDAGLPVIYANDNFGRWRSDFHALVRHCFGDVQGRRLAELLAPSENDYFVLKAKHSAFYSTTMELLLHHLGVERLVLTGITTDICILFTANDAYMRGFEIIVPEDCVTAVEVADSKSTLRLMSRVLKADTRKSQMLDLLELGRTR